MRNAPIALAAWLVLLAGGVQAQACEGKPGGVRLIVSIENVRSDAGLMTASLYGADKTQFLVKNGALRVWRVAARKPTTTMCISLAAPGSFAVAVYHDANSNLKLDVGPLGPTEGYGFSNNPRILFSKPSLASTEFVAHPGDNFLHIRLRYP